jgi:TPR repeat protein
MSYRKGHVSVLDWVFYDEAWLALKRTTRRRLGGYRKAADQGLTAAQMALATTYEDGYRVPKITQRWRSGTRGPLKEGDVDSQRKIAFFNLLGRGVPTDLVRTHMWANLDVAREQARYQGFN